MPNFSAKANNSKCYRLLLILLAYKISGKYTSIFLIQFGRGLFQRFYNLKVSHCHSQSQIQLSYEQVDSIILCIAICET
jgi:predicted peroxiredoxin